MQQMHGHPCLAHDLLFSMSNTTHLQHETTAATHVDGELSINGLIYLERTSNLGWMFESVSEKQINREKSTDELVVLVSKKVNAQKYKHT
jgi:hypothetical protein